MEKLIFDTQSSGNKFKVLNATNGGPWHKRHAQDQWRSNLEAYKEARIPFSRTHDSNVCGSIYGGPYSYDITAIFPNFDADPRDPSSYDFDCTDEAISVTLEAGTQTFFRLGQTIEHQVKKHGTLPPKDFTKWAIICEHIIKHYNYGWANGFHLNIEYWEIWNEPDLDEDDSTNKRTWGGTKKQFFDLYETAAKHLKMCFPELKIGGPALAWREDWAQEFLSEMKKRNAPLDFFSWHIYCTEPKQLTDKAERIKKLLLENGFDKAESILNEWNYVKNWEDLYVYSMKVIHSLKGAAFIMACICASQHSCVDMLMYYDTRPSSFNGIFDFYTYENLKGYYSLKWYGMFYDMQNEIPCSTQIENIYTLCGIDKLGKTLTTIAYYTDNDCAQPKTIAVEFPQSGTYEIYLLDEEHNGDFIEKTSDLTFILNANSCLLIKEI